jgi:beta-lactamase regulating signal transducer with metallopeptidase domain
MNNLWLAMHAWTLVWQSTLWLTIGLVGGHVLRRHAAAAHLALLLATVAAVVSPTLTLAVRQLQWGVLPPARSEMTATVINPPSLQTMASADLRVRTERPGIATAVGVSVPSRETPPSAAEPPTVSSKSWFRDFSQRLPIMLASVWVGCSLGLSIRLAASLRAGMRVVGQATPETDCARLSALGHAADSLAIRSAPLLRVSTVVRCPMIWCWGRRPTLLAPHSTAGRESVNWTSIFCHELAHWLRADHWASLCADLVVIAVPWQPLAWNVRRRLALCREQACDDWVLTVGVDATDYAESLLRLVPQNVPAVGLSALDGPKSLQLRLDHLFSVVDVSPRVGKPRFAAAVLVALAAVVGVALAQQKPAGDRSAARSATNDAVAGVPGRSAEAEKTVRYKGRIVEPHGRPAAGAQVFFARSRAPENVELKATTTASGAFEFTVPADVLFGNRWLRIVAAKPGLGMAWIPAEELKTTSDLQLRLVADDLPVEGRVLNLEGRPVVGATVRVTGIDSFANDNPQPYLELLKTDEMKASNFQFPSWLREIPQALSARTDTRGRFQLAGIGRHRRALLMISGNAIADTPIQVLTDPVEGTFNASQTKYFADPVHGAQFTHHVRPSRPIVGAVTDAETRRPIAGARVSQLGGVSRAVTDASGRFELQGCAKADEYRLYATPPQGQTTYFTGSLTARDRPGLEPIDVQLHLYPAIPLAGRVVDSVTGKPVPAAVSYWPVARNAYIVKEMAGTAIRVSGPFSTSFTKLDGSFALGVLPGPGALVVSIPGKADFEPAHVDAAKFFRQQAVRYDSDQGEGQAQDYLMIAVAKDAIAATPQSQFQGIALLNVPETAKQLTQNIDVRSKAKGQ